MSTNIAGNEQAKKVLWRMIESGRVPRAMIFAGEEALGKKLFAQEFARALKCTSRDGPNPCGSCFSCRCISRFNYATSNKPEDLKRIIWTDHRDVGMIQAPARVIGVGQVRDIEDQANLRPADGLARVFIIDDAEKLNPEASNALLKILEDTPETSYVILITSQLSRLLPTIRSRCLIIRFAPLENCEIESLISERRKTAREETQLISLLSQGRPGVALTLDVESYQSRRSVVLKVLESLTLRPDTVTLLKVSETLKDDCEIHLKILEALIHDLWLITLDVPGAAVINEDLRPLLNQMRTTVKSHSVAKWISRIQEMRSHLEVTINRRIAMDALFLAMASEN